MQKVRNYINGKWVDSETKEYGDVWNPGTGEKIGEVPFSTQADVDKAVQVAKEAFWDWRSTPPLTRARFFFKLKEAFEKSFEDIARSIVMENGKPLDEARAEMRRLIENVEHATGVTTMMTGYNLEDIAQGIDCTAERQPVGVFMGMGPYNFPALAYWLFLPYAVVCGNTFITKPSEQAPFTTTRIFEVIDECGFPGGVINLIHGAKETVNVMLHHPGINGVSFMGSSAVGRYVYKVCGEVGKRVQCLSGAKNFILVMPDANLDTAIPALIASFFGAAGQRCLAGGVLVAVGDVYKDLKTRFVEAARNIKIGNGIEEGVQMGSVISKSHKERVLGYIEKGVREGAKLILDGRDVKVDRYPNGFYVGPTILDEVAPHMTVAKEEIFGPVAPLLRVETLDEGLKLIQNSPYGNSACIFTSSGKTARDFKYRANAGMLGVNVGVAAPLSYFPFGGIKNSFFGDIKGQGREAFQFFTDTKVVIQRW